MEIKIVPFWYKNIFRFSYKRVHYSSSSFNYNACYISIGPFDIEIMD